MKKKEHINENNKKIVKAIEKISLLIRILLWDKTNELKLSPLQIQLLYFIYLSCNKKINITLLSREFNLRSSTISDAIKVLEKKSILSKVCDKHDKRNYYIKLTKEGISIALRILDWQNKINRVIDLFSEEEKEKMGDLLMKFIRFCQEEGVINVREVCFSCENFRKNIKLGSKKPHYCILTENYISDGDMKFNCINYKEIKT